MRRFELFPFLQYYQKRHQYHRRRKVTPSLAPRQDLLQCLLQDGIAIMENFIDRAEALRLGREVQHLWQNRANHPGMETLRKNGRDLILDIDRWLPETKVFFESDLVNGLALAYLSPEAVPLRKSSVLTDHANEDANINFYHFDHWERWPRAFLYLTDVTELNAPMYYLKGSHHWGLWRQSKEQDFFRYYEIRLGKETHPSLESRYTGCFLPPESSTLSRQLGFSEVVCTGQAGTLVVFDTYGLHRASPLQQGYRLAFSTTWRLPEVSFPLEQTTEQEATRC